VRETAEAEERPTRSGASPTAIRLSCGALLEATYGARTPLKKTRVPTGRLHVLLFCCPRRMEGPYIVIISRMI
jgi:hypothetical protein